MEENAYKKNENTFSGRDSRSDIKGRTFSFKQYFNNDLIRHHLAKRQSNIHMKRVWIGTRDSRSDIKGRTFSFKQYFNNDLIRHHLAKRQSNIHMKRVWIGTKEILEDEGLLKGSEEKIKLFRIMWENN